MVWIILGHTLMMPSAITGYDNPMDVVAPWGAAGSPWLQLVLGAELGVDSFFFLSGLLVAQIGFPEIARRRGGGVLPCSGRVTPSSGGCFHPGAQRLTDTSRLRARSPAGRAP